MEQADCIGIAMAGKLVPVGGAVYVSRIGISGCCGCATVREHGSQTVFDRGDKPLIHALA